MAKKLKSFCVVEFVQEGTLTTVPSTWLDASRSFCYFPDSKSSKIGSLRSKANSYPSPTWPKYNVRIRYHSGESHDHLDF